MADILITGGQGQISGSFTVQSANDLAILLRAGALPAPLTIIEERTVGPGLGQDSIAKGELAAYVGNGLSRLFTTKDHAEAAAAFSEKRAAVFEGH